MELAKIMDKKAQSTHFYKTWQQLVAMPTPEPFDWLVIACMICKRTQICRRVDEICRRVDDESIRDEVTKKTTRKTVRKYSYFLTAD